MARLTPFSKILIAGIIVAGIGYLLYQLRSPEVQDKINEISGTDNAETKKVYIFFVIPYM